MRTLCVLLLTIASAFSSHAFGNSSHQYIEQSNVIKWAEKGKGHAFLISGGEFVRDEDTNQNIFSIDYVHTKGNRKERNTLNIIRKIGSKMRPRRVQITDATTIAFNFSEEASILTVGIVETSSAVDYIDGLIRIAVEP